MHVVAYMMLSYQHEATNFLSSKTCRSQIFASCRLKPPLIYRTATSEQLHQNQSHTSRAHVFSTKPQLLQKLTWSRIDKNELVYDDQYASCHIISRVRCSSICHTVPTWRLHDFPRSHLRILSQRSGHSELHQRPRPLSSSSTLQHITRLQRGHRKLQL